MCVCMHACACVCADTSMRWYMCRDQRTTMQWMLSFSWVLRTELWQDQQDFPQVFLPASPSLSLPVYRSLPSVGAASVHLTFIMEVWILGGKQKLIQLKLSENLQKSCLVYSGGSSKSDFEMWHKIHYSNAPNLLFFISIFVVMWLPYLLITWLWS